jgi:hypothetical protein
MRHGLAAVLLCVLVAGAGCSAIPGTGGNGDGIGGGDAPVSDSVPGVANGSLEDPSALLDAHVAAVTETGYSQSISVNLTDASEGETYAVSQRQRTGVAAGAVEYEYQTITNSQVSSRIQAWGNESVEYQRGETGGGDPQYRRVDSQPPERLAGRAVLDQRLSTDFEVVDVEERDDAPDVVTLEVSGLPEENEAFDGQEQVENLRQFEAQLVVDTEGRVHSYAAAAVYDIEGETADYDYQFQMTGFEDPGVEQPDWIDEAEG